MGWEGRRWIVERGRLLECKLQLSCTSTSNILPPSVRLATTDGCREGCSLDSKTCILNRPRSNYKEFIRRVRSDPATSMPSGFLVYTRSRDSAIVKVPDWAVHLYSPPHTRRRYRQRRQPVQAAAPSPRPHARVVRAEREAQQEMYSGPDQRPPWQLPSLATGGTAGSAVLRQPVSARIVELPPEAAIALRSVPAAERQRRQRAPQHAAQQQRPVLQAAPRLQLPAPPLQPPVPPKDPRRPTPHL